MAATKSHASRAAGKAAQDQQQPGPQPELPTATFDLGAGRIVYYRPSLTLPDGTVLDCEHQQWGHGTEKTALACARKMAAEHGVELAR
jgi:hypothetical protein